jgi:hypothetical protein
MPHDDVRGDPRGLRADDALMRDARDPPFRVRRTPKWKKHAANLELEMLRRGMSFEVIDWVPRAARGCAGALLPELRGRTP